MRTGGAILIALVLHVALLLAAYLRPIPQLTKRSKPIEMEVVTRPKPPPPPPPEIQPPPQPPPAAPQRTAENRPPSRPLPKELQPVPRPSEVPEPGSPAISVPVQPPGPPEKGPPGLPKGPIDLFPKSIGSVVGVPGANAPIPKGPNRLFKDERLEEKKEAEFVLVPEKGGGYKADSRNFIAHIKPDGTVSFEDRFPIGFNKGGTFSFDLTDLAMRGKKQDPYAAERRRFLEFSEKTRDELKKKALEERRQRAQTHLSEELADIWNSERSAASRRHQIYEKWAECSDDKEDVVGRKGRHTIEDFIRGHLPKGSPDAFTDDELGRIADERKGLPPFDPYGAGTP